MATTLDLSNKNETYSRVFTVIEKACYPNSIPVGVDPNVVKATREVFRILGLNSEPDLRPSRR